MTRIDANGNFAEALAEAMKHHQRVQEETELARKKLEAMRQVLEQARLIADEPEGHA